MDMKSQVAQNNTTVTMNSHPSMAARLAARFDAAREAARCREIEFWIFMGHQFNK
jgi:hypothetical protein